MLDQIDETPAIKETNQRDIESLLRLALLACKRCMEAWGELELRHICIPEELSVHVELEHSSGGYFHEFWFRLEDRKVVVDGNLCCDDVTAYRMFRNRPYDIFTDGFPATLSGLHEDYLND